MWGRSCWRWGQGRRRTARPYSRWTPIKLWESIAASRPENLIVKASIAISICIGLTGPLAAQSTSTINPDEPTGALRLKNVRLTSASYGPVFSQI